MQADPEEILCFWFGDTVSSATTDSERAGLWFGGDAATDRTIRERFATLPASAVRGELDTWREQPRPALARVLTLDQFPRNIYRGTADSYAFDPHALDAARAAIDRGFDDRLEPVEAVFLYMPFEHSEDIRMQELCLELFQKLVERTPAHLKQRIRSFESYAVRHHKVIERFGRFPHRNAVLGRASTGEERSYLESGGDTF